MLYIDTLSALVLAYEIGGDLVSASVAQGKLQNFVRALREAAIDLDVNPVLPTLQAYGVLQLDRARYLSGIDQHFAKLARGVARQNEIKEHIKRLLETARACELAEDPSGRHAERMGALGRLIAKRASFSEKSLDQLEIAIRLHDIGKTGLNQAAILSPQTYGAELVVQMFGQHAENGASKIARQGDIGLTLSPIVCQSHHERWNGTGYPEGLAGTDIPFPARVAAIVDTFDTVVHGRSYRPALSVQSALLLIMADSRRAFDPDLVLILRDIVTELGDEITQLAGTEDSVLVANLGMQWARSTWTGQASSN
jgi:HD-GYP domain-containing protein (c-di-GMP phosphodiesterase class II)